MMPAMRIEGRRSTRHRTLKMGEVGHSALQPSLLSEQFRVFLLLYFVDLFDVLIGDLLDLFQPLLLVVFGDLMILEQLLESLIALAAHLPYGVTAFLGELV